MDRTSQLRLALIALLLLLALPTVRPARGDSTGSSGVSTSRPAGD